MAQKSLFKNKKNPSQKAAAVNRHGKIAKTKKGISVTSVQIALCTQQSRSNSCLYAGNLTAPPKRAHLLKAYTDNKVDAIPAAKQWQVS